MHFLIILTGLFVAASDGKEEIRWCLVSDAERAKCDHFSAAIYNLEEMSQLYTLICVSGRDTFDCMSKISKHTADVMGLDIGLGYHASQNNGLRAIAFENYSGEKGRTAPGLQYVANAVVVRGSLSHPKDLLGAASCHPSAGSAEGWIYPLSKIINKKWLKINQCNSEVKTANQFFEEGSCAPGSLLTIFNPLGDNPKDSCSRCASDSDSRRFCSSNDQFSGNAGAMLCLDRLRLLNKMVVAFVRGDIIARMVDTGDIDPDHFELLCSEKQNDGSYLAPLNQITKCNWGTPQSRVIMTQLTSNRLNVIQDFLKFAIYYFGPNGTMQHQFKLFASKGSYNFSQELQMSLGMTALLYPLQPSYDLMFSDLTQDIYFPPNSELINFDDLMSQDLKEALEILNKCPFPTIKWCVINEDELHKCGEMKLAINSHRLKPGLQCLLGNTTSDCIHIVSEGFADITTVDAAEMYVAGKYFGLVPIATESYGKDYHYYVVAVAKRENKDILISNWKDRYLCLGGAGKASGWVMPITAALNTNQFRVENRSLISSFSQLVKQACIPGVLDEDFSRKERHPINICELCSAGGADLCRPSGIEGYYLDVGALCCLVEIGQLAFMRHYTVHDNTDGRNSADWARNLRSDDFELICPGGRRTDIYNWENCNIGRVPANFVVTARFKSQDQRDNIWNFLRFSQALFESDSNPIFSMFKSTYNRYDLIFSDSTTYLKAIPPMNQSYDIVLDPSFIRICTHLENLSKPGHSGFYTP